MVVQVLSTENIYWCSVIARSVLSNAKTGNRETSSNWYRSVWEERIQLKWTRGSEEHPNVYVSTVVHMIH